MTPHSYPFLSKEECDAICKEVFSLRDSFIKIPYADEYASMLAEEALEVNAYTLGNALYILEAYPDQYSKEIRDLVDKTFKPLQQKAIAKVQELLGIPEIKLFDDITVPGFHIFEGPLPKLPINLLHIDMSIFKFKPAEEDYVFSFAVSLSDVEDTPTLHWSDSIKDDTNFNLHYYKTGELNMWSAYMPHCIGPIELKKGEARVTYQGHVCKIDNEYYAYF